MERIGVIGLGRMGSAIAQRMQDKGHQVMGWTRSGTPVAGITSATDLSSLATQSDTLILSLFDDDAVANVLDQLLDLDLAGQQIIDTSTVLPETLKSRIDAIARNGATAVDAPISGGPELVRAGGCGIFIGGDDAAAQRAQATLAAISGRIFHVGPLGTGLVMKTLNNSMIQTYFAGLTELLPMAKRAGLPLDTAMQILCGGPAGMPMIADRMPKILGQDTSVGFAMSAVAKDNHVFRNVIRSFGLECPIMEIAKVQQQKVLDAGLSEADPAAMVPFGYAQG